MKKGVTTLIVKERITAEVDGDFVVFLIGMRVNNIFKIHKWLPVASAMPRMLTELYRNPELGLISHEQWFGRTTIMLQYWRSFDHLESYAKAKNSNHLPAWSAFNRNIGSNGAVGIWHETYIIRAGTFESVYNNMPVFGLAKATRSVPAIGKYKDARSRVG